MSELSGRQVSFHLMFSYEGNQFWCIVLTGIFFVPVGWIDGYRDRSLLGYVCAYIHVYIYYIYIPIYTRVYLFIYTPSLTYLNILLYSIYYNTSHIIEEIDKYMGLIF